MILENMILKNMILENMILENKSRCGRACFDLLKRQFPDHFTTVAVDAEAGMQLPQSSFCIAGRGWSIP